MACDSLHALVALICWQSTLRHDNIITSSCSQSFEERVCVITSPSHVGLQGIWEQVVMEHGFATDSPLVVGPHAVPGGQSLLFQNVPPSSLWLVLARGATSTSEKDLF